MPPEMSHQVLVGVPHVFVDIAAKLFGCIGSGTNIQLASVDEEGRRIAIGQFVRIRLRGVSGGLRPSFCMVPLIPCGSVMRAKKTKQTKC